MRKAHWWGLGALVGTLGVVVAATAQQAQPGRPAQPGPQAQRPADRRQPATFQGRMLAATRLPEADLKKFLAALGPAVAGTLASGQQVQIPGLGTFRVVNIPPHRDMVNGRPAIIDSSNYVEFVPAGGLVGAANAPGATPAVTVPPFEYIPLPGQTPSMRVPGTRTLSPRQP
jgi:nucleoid DNA-binding protein